MRRTLDELNAADAERLHSALTRRVSPQRPEFYSTSAALIAVGCR